MRLICALAIALAATACGPKPYAVLADTADPLRTQFNQDVGRPRIVILVAPT